MFGGGALGGLGANTTRLLNSTLFTAGCCCCCGAERGIEAARTAAAVGLRAEGTTPPGFFREGGRGAAAEAVAVAGAAVVENLFKVRVQKPGRGEAGALGA